MVQWFIDGGWCMWPLLFLLVLGIGFAIERLITLSRAGINAKAFFGSLEQALRDGGAEKAAELCSRTRGPVASILHAGLLRLDRGVDEVEKAIENSADVEMAFLERGMIILATVATLAPMVGFLGTVSGMISAFQAIKVAGDVVPSQVAGGISQALITTQAGLVIGIIAQTCYNYFASRIDRIVVDMREQGGAFVDLLAETEGSGRRAAEGAGA
ncbi:MAG: MotA/TolQ/ExbB proton channel family protein [Candidatus Latescibacterota bacterium]